MEPSRTAPPAQSATELESSALSALATQAAVSLAGLALVGLLRLDKTIALSILDKIASGKAAYSFGVRIDGQTCEFVGHVLEGSDSLHLLSLTTQTPALQPLH